MLRKLRLRQKKRFSYKKKSVEKYFGCKINLSRGSGRIILRDNFLDMRLKSTTKSYLGLHLGGYKKS